MFDVFLFDSFVLDKETDLCSTEPTKREHANRENGQAILGYVC